MNRIAKEISEDGGNVVPQAKRKSLGWIPFKKTAIKHLATRQSGKKSLKSTIQLSLAKGKKLIIDVWDSYNLSLYSINTCELVQDNRGHISNRSKASDT